MTAIPTAPAHAAPSAADAPAPDAAAAGRSVSPFALPFTGPFTCPFCSLHCDDIALAGTPETPAIAATVCARASAALSALQDRQGSIAAEPGASAATAGAAHLAAQIAGRPATLDAALQRAAELLAASRQPLFGGLATDINGARALVKLAGQCGAICDHAHGKPLALATRVLHDQGAWQVTLGEVAARAEMIVVIGADPVARHPRFWQRINAHRPGSPLRRVVFVGLRDDPAQAAARLQGVLTSAGRSSSSSAIEVSQLASGADLFDTVQALALALRPRPPRGLAPAWTQLAAELRACAYTSFVWEAGVLPRHGELIAGAIQSIVATLNISTRAGSVALAGGDGAATAQQVHTWLTGLPLRTRLPSAAGGRIEHDPIQHGANRLLSDHGCDALLWVSSISALAPPAAAAGLPTIVLGPPALAPAEAAAAPAVFIAVATPGLHHVGHLFRSDGIIAMPLQAPLSSPLPDVADIARRLSAALAALATTPHRGVTA